MAELISFLPPSFPSPELFFILKDFNGHHFFWDSRGTYDPRKEKVLDWVICFNLLPLNNPDITTLLHRSSGIRSFPDISFAPSSFALSCPLEVLQDLGSDHLPILLIVPFSPVFYPTNVSLPSIFRKFVGMTLPFTLTPAVLQQRNNHLFPLLLFSRLLL